MQTEFELKSIGQVFASEDGFCLALNQRYIPALKGLDGFSYLNVLWWANLLDSKAHRERITCKKPYKNTSEDMGVFATRSPCRPNPIGLSVVSVLRLDYDQGKIYIPYMDAEENTPILDIKPYHPSIDRVKAVSVPEWCRHWPQWFEDSGTFDWSAEFKNA